MPNHPLDMSSWRGGHCVQCNGRESVDFGDGRQVCHWLLVGFSCLSEVPRWIPFASQGSCLMELNYFQPVRHGPEMLQCDEISLV